RMNCFPLSNCERTDPLFFSAVHPGFFQPPFSFLLYKRAAASGHPLKNAVLVLSEVRGTGTAKFFSAEKSRFCPFRGRGAEKPLGNGGAADAGKFRDNERQAA